MDLQLELIPFHYYNTLGFDVELIDYIDHVDDSIVLEKIKPLYKDGGRPPGDPRTYFRMHYLGIAEQIKKPITTRISPTFCRI